MRMRLLGASCSSFKDTNMQISKKHGCQNLFAMEISSHVKNKLSRLNSVNVLIFVFGFIYQMLLPKRPKRMIVSIVDTSAEAARDILGQF